MEPCRLTTRDEWDQYLKGVSAVKYCYLIEDCAAHSVDVFIVLDYDYYEMHHVEFMRKLKSDADMYAPLMVKFNFHLCSARLVENKIIDTIADKPAVQTYEDFYKYTVLKIASAYNIPAHLLTQPIP